MTRHACAVTPIKLVTPSAELQVRSLQELQELASQLETDLRNR